MFPYRAKWFVCAASRPKLLRGLDAGQSDEADARGKHQQHDANTRVRHLDRSGLLLSRHVRERLCTCEDDCASEVGR
jgi:hypothetical protein